MKRNHFPALHRKGFQLYTDRMPTKTRIEHEGASTGRRMGGWLPSGSGPNSTQYGQLITLRSRTRDAIRNNPWAYSALESWVTNLVGRGITPRWKLENEKLRKEIHQAWDDWVPESDADGQLNFYGQQALFAKTIVHSGECLARLRSRRIQDGLSVPLQLQLLEPDFLDDFKTGLGENGTTFHQGIELSAIGARAAYWLRKVHPGDALFMPGSLVSTRVPASQVIHGYRVDRPGQMRGIPWFSVVLARMFLLDQYEDAELDRKKTAALFAGFIKKTGDFAGPGGVIGFDQDENRDDLDRPFAELEPGMLNYLLPGEDVEFATPADVGGNYEPWMKMNLRAIAAGIGITYEQLTGDMSGINFSAARARIIEFRRQARQLIGTMLNFQFNQKLARPWMAAAVASGRLKIKDFAENPQEYLRIDWRPDAWEWVQPNDDLQVAKHMVRNGFKTREDIVTELGGDVEVIDKRNNELNKSMDELDLMYDSDPRRVSNAGLTQARTEGTAFVPDTDEEGNPKTNDEGKPVDKDGKTEDEAKKPNPFKKVS